jgi:hypothetical protein
MQPGRSRDYGLYRRGGGTHIGRPSTNIDRRTPDVLDYARVDEPKRTESRPPSSTSGAIGVNAAHVTPRKIRLVGVLQLCLLRSWICRCDRWADSIDRSRHSYARGQSAADGGSGWQVERSPCSSMLRQLMVNWACVDPKRTDVVL